MRFFSSFFRIREPVPFARRIVLVTFGLILFGAAYDRVGKNVDEKYSPTVVQILRATKDLYEIRKSVPVVGEAAVSGEPEPKPETVSLLMEDIRESLLRLGSGFGAGMLAAILFGSLIAAFKDLEGVFALPITVLAAVPPIAFMAYFMIVLGGGFEFQLGIVAYAVFLDLAPKVKNALDQVSKQSVDALFTLGASRFEVWIHMIRQSLPEIMRGAHLSLNLAWVYLIAAESVGAESGLGIRILKLKRYTQIDRMFGVILIIGLIALLLDVFFRYGNLLAFPWDDVNRREIVRIKGQGWYRVLSRLFARSAVA